MKYSLGLDVGTTSIGWAVIDLDNNRVHDVGVRIFEKPEDPQSGKSLAEPRRTARSTRRRLKRRRQRLNALKSFFTERKLLSSEQIEKLLSPNNQYDPYELRTRAVAEKVSNEELFLALYHIAKRRGYKSNSKAQDEDVLKRIAAQKEKSRQKQEAGKEVSPSDDRLKVLSAVYDNKDLLVEYKTVAGTLTGADKFKSHKRNKADSYQGSFMRENFEDEANIILRKQSELGLNLSDDDINKLLYGGSATIRDDGIIITTDPGIFYQRPFMNAKLINGMRGKDIYNGEDRAPKASVTFEIFRLAEDIAHIKNSKNPEWQISREQAEAIIAKAKTTKNVTYGAIREALGFKNNYDEFCFDYIRGKNPDVKKIKDYESLTPDEKLVAEIKEREKTTFVQMDFYHTVGTALKEFPEKFTELESSIELFDAVGETLTVNKDDESITKKLRELGFSDNEIKPLLLLNFSKFGNLSLATMRKAIPFMLGGRTYDKALEEVYPGKFAAKLSGDKLKLPPLNEQQSQQITNPVVKRAISQTVKVVNAVIDKYGSPARIGIEAAGDLAKSSDERKKIKTLQDNNAEYNSNIASYLAGDRDEKLLQKLSKDKDYARLKDEFSVSSPTGLQITKFKLYQQQNGKCMYSGKALDLNRLFADEHYGEIDHIIPFSRCGNDSLNNKVLVLTEANQNKGNLMPYEAWGDDETKWKEYEARVKATFLPFAKKDRLLATSLPAEEWNIRALNDTRYISKFLRQYLRENLKFDNDQGSQRVITPTGPITSYLRRLWRVGGKSREENNLHHAADACIIASVDQGVIQKVSSLNKYYELFYGNDKNEITNKLTGEIVHRGDVEQHIADVQPWEEFGREVRMRTAEYKTPSELHNELRGLLNYDNDFRESVKPIFVSRMPKRSGKGSTNQETIRSPKIVEDYENNKGEKVIARKQRVALSSVKLKDLYDSPIRETDPKLYELLKQRLEENGDDPKKAFSKPIYKPTKTGERGNVVRGIKVYDTLKSKTGFGINLDKEGNPRAFVNNGSIIRLDVYQKVSPKGKNEHFFVPIYAHQVGLEKSGQKITKILPEPKGFTDVDDTFTKIASLFPNDYVRIYMGNKIIEGYYNNYDSASGQMTVVAHQSANKEAKNLIRCSARSALDIQRLDISVLGDNYKWI